MITEKGAGALAKGVRQAENKILVNLHNNPVKDHIQKILRENALVTFYDPVNPPEPTQGPSEEMWSAAKAPEVADAMKLIKYLEKDKPKKLKTWQIETIVLARERLRQVNDFDTSDDIRDFLGKYGIVIR